ncbi:MAG: succinate dehydrogenase cytochrome b subunit [Gemmatimonadetes bacterium]|nr:succinate dehydrogenase cytochrome b subunit [Gemmatimonadota bacterium]
MNGYLRALSSTVGTKYLVAVTGLVWVLFVTVHMLGNLQIYLGPEAINSYAAFLKSKPGPLWVARVILLAALVVHVWGITKLTLANREARPIPYAVKKTARSTFSSRTMVMSGLVLLSFVIYHLLHFTIGITHPEHFHLRDSMGRHDVYSMTILGFQQPIVSIAYIVATALLGLHLSHGVASLFQTMGASRPKIAPLIERFSLAVTLMVVSGNIAIPLSALFGLIEPAQGPK